MIYVCGDSFGVQDPEYGACWIDYLAQHTPTTTQAQVCASNLLIAQQVDQAISASAEFIILLCTASTRGQTRLHNKIVPYSIHSLDATTPFNVDQLQLLKNYTAEFFDLDLAIYENKCIIESMLSRLKQSKIPFVWDQGGFEHPSYGGVGQYFAEYAATRSEYNLWDYASVRHYRPYYHIMDPQVHIDVARYYAGLIDEQT